MARDGYMPATASPSLNIANALSGQRRPRACRCLTLLVDYQSSPLLPALQDGRTEWQLLADLLTEASGIAVSPAQARSFFPTAEDAPSKQLGVPDLSAVHRAGEAAVHVTWDRHARGVCQVWCNVMVHFTIRSSIQAAAFPPV